MKSYKYTNIKTGKDWSVINIIRKITAVIISSVIMISFVAFAPQGSAKTYVNVITASAADSMKKPVLIKRQAYSNKIEAGVKNLTSFSSKTTF